MFCIEILSGEMMRKRMQGGKINMNTVLNDEHDKMHGHKRVYAADYFLNVLFFIIKIYATREFA